MTPGPNIILKIPSSGELVKIATIASGNTCRARFWTDGKCEAPMLPDNPWLRVHPNTGEMFWSDECKEVDREAPWELKRKYARIPLAGDPGLDDYRRAVNGGWGNTAPKNSYLLLRFWWAANDPCRYGKPKAARPPDFREKVLDLFSCMDPQDPYERMLMADMRRQLGDFATVKDLLENNVPKPCSFHRRIILQWNDRNDTSVRELRELNAPPYVRR